MNNRLKKKRVQLDISAKEVSEKLGISKSTLHRYEKNDFDKMPIDVLKNIANIYKTTPTYLLGFEDEPMYLDKYEIKLYSDEKLTNKEYEELKLYLNFIINKRTL